MLCSICNTKKTKKMAQQPPSAPAREIHLSVCVGMWHHIWVHCNLRLCPECGNNQTLISSKWLDYSATCFPCKPAISDFPVH